MLILTLYGWLIFRSNNAEQLIAFSKEFFLFNFDGLSKERNIVYLLWTIVFWLIILIQDYIVEYRKNEITLNFSKFYHLIPLCFILTVIYIFGAKQSEFIYFQF